MRNIYLAGKISKNGWRHDIVKNLRDYDSGYTGQGVSCGDNSFLTKGWPIIEKAIYREIDGGFNYTGPFFVGCDHGCFHGEGTHGTSDYSGMGHWDDDRNHRETVVTNCLEAIKKSDIVFAWIDSVDCYGTIAELAYAKAIGKDIFITGPEYFGDLWFLYQMDGGMWGEYKTPQEALVSVLKHYLSENQVTELSRLCESPIEVKYLEAIYPELPQITPQYQVNGYRLDFALPDKQIAIELDGHEFHKTKEQRTNDAERERHLELSGWRVIRFTGSEIYQDVNKCVNQTMKLIAKWSS